MKENILIELQNFSEGYKEEYIYDKNRMKRVNLRQLLLSQSSKIEIFYLILGILGAICNGITAQLLEYFTGKLITYFSEENSSDSMILHLKEILISYIIVSILSFIFGFMLMSFCSLFQKKISKKYKQKYFEMLISMDMEWFDKSGQSIFEINNQILLELDSIDKGIGNSIGLVFNQISLLVFGYCFSFYICWKFALILLCLLPVSLVIELIIGFFSQKNMIKQKKISEEIGGYLEEKLYKIKTVASFVNYDYEISHFNNKLNIFISNSKEKSIINGLLQSSQTLIMGILMALSLLTGGYLIYEETTIRDRKVTSGDLYAILEIIMGCNAEIQNISQHVKLIANALESAKSFFNLKEYYERKIKNKENGLFDNFDENSIEGKIEFKNVFFSYPKNNENIILENFNLVLNPKETTAIVGESGCGKSTIINIIERLYNVEKGEIILDDKYNIYNININKYRKLFGYVSQEPILFNESIKNNILLGREATNEEIFESTKNTNILNFINNLKKKFGYKAGVQGAKLSGGQKQRIAISRAIILKPKILIFDEATSALDLQNEIYFKSLLNSFKGKYTILIISHKINVIKNADKIIVLGKGGKIIEMGNHDDLMERKGNYYEMFNNEKSNISNIIKNDNDESLEEETESNNDKETIDKELLFHTNEKSKNKSCILNQNINNNTLYYKKFLKIIEEYKILLIIGLLFSFLSGISIVYLGLILGKSIDKITNPNLEQVKKEGIKYSKKILIFTIISTTIDFIRFFSVEFLGDKLSSNFKSKIFKMYLKMHMAFFDSKKNSPGQLVSEMNLKTSTINDAVLSLLSSLIQCIADFIAATVIGFIYSWKMTLINSCFIPIIFIINYFHTAYISYLEKDSLNNHFGNIISETLCNLSTVFSFNSQSYMKKMFQKEIDKETNNIYIKCFVSGFLQGLVNSIIFLDYGICFYYTGLDVVKNKLSLENFLKCYASIMTATFYIGTTVNSIKNIALMKQSIFELIDLLETKSEINPFDNNNNLVKIDKKLFRGKIEFKNVFFSYPKHSKKYILKNVNMVIEPGDKICFIGESGSGKSTIGQLIERFYDIEKGEILIDDINIKNYNLISLRKNISYVSQEPVLFNNTIINNIKYGNSDLKFQEIQKYAEICKVSEKLNENNFDNLSGGQKQRIALIRAILKKSKILILDEATSALDNKTEIEIKNFIFDYINENNITTIIISHKLKSFNNYNKIYRIIDSNIIEFKNSI